MTLPIACNLLKRWQLWRKDFISETETQFGVLTV